MNQTDRPPADKRIYSPLLKERWPDQYFDDRQTNNQARLAQFKLDRDLIHQYVTRGTLCDIGCSTGEFVRFLDWQGECYGMEINDKARAIASDVISFEKNIFTETGFFDLVIFRGTIQHVDEPFRMIKESFSALKNGGWIVFLATPNINSPLYRLKGNLPFLDPATNFYLPGAKGLSNALENFGFRVKAINYPYLKTPYAKPLQDHFAFLLNLFTPFYLPHPFWRSSMNIFARKE